MKELWLFALLIIFPTSAAAGIASAKTADDLMEDCRYVDADWNTITSAQMVAVSGCMQYIIGVLDGYSFGVRPSGKERTMVCNVPDTVTTKQLALIVAHYLRDNPADLHLPASFVVMKAVDKAFPCNTESH